MRGRLEAICIAHRFDSKEKHVSSPLWQEEALGFGAKRRQELASPPRSLGDGALSPLASFLTTAPRSWRKILLGRNGSKRLLRQICTSKDRERFCNFNFSEVNTPRKGKVEPRVRAMSD